MILTPLIITLLYAAVPILAQLDPTTAKATLPGTWSSGSQAVITGLGFANPANQSFTYPALTGISYSFTTDGYYEIARYRMVSNGTVPQCITGVMNWVHGNYTLQPNGSMTLLPFDDGFQQIQDPCAPQSNFIEPYNDTELYAEWMIFQDPVAGYKLHMFQFDGSPLAPMFQHSATPNMLPTHLLRNVTTNAPPTTNAGLTTQNAVKVNSGRPRWSRSEIMSVMIVMFATGLSTLLL